MAWEWGWREGLTSEGTLHSTPCWHLLGIRRATVSSVHLEFGWEPSSTWIGDNKIANNSCVWMMQPAVAFTVVLLSSLPISTLKFVPWGWPPTPTPTHTLTSQVCRTLLHFLIQVVSGVCMCSPKSCLTEVATCTQYITIIYSHLADNKCLRNKSDVSYLKTCQPFDIPIHSRALLAAILCWLVTW